MKSLPLKSFFILMAFAMMPIFANAQTDTPSDAGSSPMSQPLIREGTLAVELAGGLKLGITQNEAEAEDLLSGAGISPRNGWIADYPVTPDIIGELQEAIGEAAASGKLSMEKNAALQALQTAEASNSLPVNPDTSGTVGDEMAAPAYPDSSAENNYYSDTGPPAVTYYAPPPDYAYLYTWVPYPFWWTDVWFPGFFVLSDFDVRVHWRYHGHDHDGFVTNHFRNPGTGVISRIDPATRFSGGTFPAAGREGPSGPGARSGAEAVLNRERAVQGGSQEFRGYGLTPRSEGVRSSAFDHSVNSQAEHAASDRGFQSRSSAGQLPAAGRVVRGPGGSAPRGGGLGGGFHGGGRR